MRLALRPLRPLLALLVLVLRQPGGAAGSTANPQTRPLPCPVGDPSHGVVHGQIRAVEHRTSNSRCSITLDATAASPDLRVCADCGTNRGDFTVAFLPPSPSPSSSAADTARGVPIPTAMAHTVDHGNGEGPQTGTVSIALDSERPEYYSVAAHQISGAEFNIDFNIAFFPLDRWLAGAALNSQNGGAITRLVASPGIQLGTQFQDFGNGQFRLSLPGVDASANKGVLLVTAAKNEDNFALSAPNADGSFSIFSHDNGRSGGSFEQDPVAFVYVPNGVAGVVSGRVLGSGVSQVASGAFSVSLLGPGVFRLGIPCGSPDSGTLILSPEGGGPSNVDNIVTATWNATHGAFVVQSRDLPDATPQAVTAGAFSFAFLFFQDACAAGPCGGNGICVREFGGHRCECAPGFRGAACEIDDAAHCAPNPCGNGGTCTPLLSAGFVCDCLPAFSGPTCATAINPVQAGAPGVVHGSVRVQQLDALNSVASVRLEVEAGTRGFGVVQGAGSQTSAGDFELTFGPGVPLVDGVGLASLRGLHVEHGQGQGRQAGVASLAVRSGALVTGLAQWPSGCELNADVAAAFFPFARGYTAGVVLEDGSLATPAAGGVVVRHTAGTGLYTLALPGLQPGSVLLASSAAANARLYPLTAPLRDSSGFDVRVRHIGAEGAVYEDGPFAFVVLPPGAPGIVFGRMRGNGTVDAASPGPAAFQVQAHGPGRYVLQIPGHSTASGTLMVASEGGGASNGDTLASFEVFGANSWLVEVRRIDHLSLAALDVGSDPAFTFVFLTFRSEDECAFVPCSNGGTCSSTPGSGTHGCACPSGFSGPSCEQNVNDCVGHMCLNGATCVDGLGSYACECPFGFVGQRCEVSVCGDGILTPAEGCDDGNTNPGDGCSAACELEHGHVCATPGRPCQAGVQIPLSAVVASNASGCLAAFCQDSAADFVTGMHALTEALASTDPPLAFFLLSVDGQPCEYGAQERRRRRGSRQLLAARTVTVEYDVFVLPGDYDRMVAVLGTEANQNNTMLSALAARPSLTCLSFASQNIRVAAESGDDGVWGLDWLLFSTVATLAILLCCAAVILCITAIRRRRPSPRTALHPLDRNHTTIALVKSLGPGKAAVLVAEPSTPPPPQYTAFAEDVQLMLGTDRKRENPIYNSEDGSRNASPTKSPFSQVSRRSTARRSPAAKSPHSASALASEPASASSSPRKRVSPRRLLALSAINERDV